MLFDMQALAVMMGTCPAFRAMVMYCSFVIYRCYVLIPCILRDDVSLCGIWQIVTV